jgi:hypothetical protein
MAGHGFHRSSCRGDGEWRAISRAREMHQHRDGAFDLLVVLDAPDAPTA